MTSAPPDLGRPPLVDAPPSRSDRFYSWTAGLGLVRSDGWIGGVAAGVAARLRIDPLVVRGILVVVALFGFPVLFLYAVAWALLPDAEGRIHLQDAQRGRFSPALVGIAAAAVLGLLPAPFALFIGAPTLFVGSDLWSIVALLLIVGGLVAGGLIFLIVRAAHRAPGVPVTDLRTASAASETPEPSADETGSGPAPSADGRAMDAAASADTASIAAPEGDAAPPADHDDSDAALAAWREQHAAWKVQDDAWRREQQDAARVAREQARRERQARAAAFAAEANERRRLRRAASPRTSAAYVAVAIGLAVVAGTVVALQGGDALAAAAGLFVAALVFAGAMVLAGILRRRSGFLAFLTVVTLAAAGVATTLPAAQDLHIGDYGISNLGGRTYPADAPFTQPWGNLTVYLADTGGAGETYVAKRNGSTQVTVEPGVEVALDVTTVAGSLHITHPDGTTVYLPRENGVAATALPDGLMRYTAIVGLDDAPATTRERLVIDQTSGYIQLVLLPRPTDGDSE